MNFPINIKTAFIFAAGLGKRLCGVSDGLPKPLVKLNQKPLVDLCVESFLNYGVENIMINLHHKSNLIKNHLSKYEDYDIIIFEEDELLETGGALINALHFIRNNSSDVLNDRLVEQITNFSNWIFTANVDVIWSNSNVLHTLEKQLNEDIYLHGKNVDIVMAFTNRNGKDVTPFYLLDNNEVIMGYGPHMFCGIQIINLNVVHDYSCRNGNKKMFSLSEIYIASKTQTGTLKGICGVLCDDVHHVGTDEEFLSFKNLDV